MRNGLMILVVAVLLVAACGSDDGDEVELGSTGGDVEETSSDDTGGDAAGGDGTGEDGTGGDEPDEAMTGDSGSDWCEAVRSAAAEEDSPLDFDLLGLTPEELEARFTENVAVLEEWEAQAPPEIESQVTTMVDAFRTVVSLAEEAEWDLMTLGTDPAFIEAFDSAELEAAADDIDRYSRDVCGVDLAGAGAGAGAAGGTDPSVPSAGGDAASDFLETFGLPPNFLTEDQLACVTAELEAAFPQGIPEDLVLDAQTVELFNTVGAACGIGTP